MRLNVSLAMHVAKTRVADKNGLHELDSKWDYFSETPLDFTRVAMSNPSYELQILHLEDKSYKLLLRQVGRTATKDLRGEFIAYITLEDLTVLNSKIEGATFYRDHPFIAPAARGSGIIRALYEWLLGQGFCLCADPYPSESINRLWQKLALVHPFLILDVRDEYRDRKNRATVSWQVQEGGNMHHPKYGAMLFGKPWTQLGVNAWAAAQRFMDREPL